MTKIRAFREQLNTSRYKLAKDTGISYKALTDIEKGGDIRLSNLYKIAKSLGVSAKELLKEEKSSDKN